MLRREKEKILATLVEDLRRYDVLFLVDFQGLNVAQMTELRRKLREAGAKFRVAKNTLIKLAKASAQRNAIPDELLVGSSALVMAENDPVSPAKVIKEFFDEFGKPKVKAITIGNTCYDAAKAEEFASLPGVDELRAKVVGAVVAPLQALVFTLSGLIRTLVTQIDALAKKKAQT